jgi:hypothetical protein
MSDALPVNNDELIEQRAVAHAFGLLAAVGDAKAAKVRLDELVKATAEHDAKLAAATAAIAEAATKSATLAKAETSLAERTADFQVWVDSTEKAYRVREDRIRTNEEAQERRERDLVDKESDLARRMKLHAERVANLRENLS